MTVFFVTGAAGFVGSTVVDRLLRDGHRVVGFDNFSTGREEFLEQARASAQFRLVRGDLLDQPALTEAMRDVEFVFHLAANADVRFGTEHPRKDLEQNTIGTFQVLEAMRANGVRRIAFSSTGSVYGEAEVFPTPENAPFPVQTSLMRQAGITNYEKFARDVLAAITDRPISFEVFSDEFREMETQALKIASWGSNVYVKIPVTNTKREPALPLIRKLAEKGVKLNVTVIMTRSMDMTTIALTGEGGGAMAPFCDILIDVPSRSTPIIQQVHICLYHYICEQVETAIATGGAGPAA